jgi:hypothetical protein
MALLIDLTSFSTRIGNVDTGSGSVMVLSTGGTAVLTGDFSKLLGETPTSTTALLSTSTSQSIPTSTDTALPSVSQSDSLSSISTPTATSSSETTDGLTNTQLGAIIGGAAGGALVLICLIWCIIYQRKKKQPSFKRGRGITPSMVFDNAETSMTVIDRPFDQQSAYSFNSPQNAFGSSYHLTPSAPSENVTATVDKLYSIKQYNHAPEPLPPQPRATNTNSNVRASGARLSKYNYLTQAFSQMRASYATQDQQQQQQQQQQTMYDNSHKGLAKPPFVQYPDPVASPPTTQLPPSSSFSSPSPHHYNTSLSSQTTTPTRRPSPPSPSSMDAPSITLFNENNESKVLHQGHALPTTTILSSQPAISTATVSKRLHFPGGGNNNRNSTLSDVSQYSTFSSSSNPFRYSDDIPPPNTTNTSPLANTPSPLAEKPYAYI